MRIDTSSILHFDLFSNDFVRPPIPAVALHVAVKVQVKRIFRRLPDFPHLFPHFSSLPSICRAAEATVSKFFVTKCHEIVMPKNTMMMIHNAWMGAVGNAAELRKACQQARLPAPAAVPQGFSAR